MAQTCESYIAEANATRGFWGANCQTWFGGLSANCKNVESQAKAQRADCYNAQRSYALSQEQTAQVLTVLKWAALAALAYFFLKWYLK